MGKTYRRVGKVRVKHNGDVVTSKELRDLKRRKASLNGESEEETLKRNYRR